MPEKPTPQPINITSVNQSGNAITAHTVNLGDPKIEARVAELAAESAARAAKAKAEDDALALKQITDRSTTIYQKGKPVAKTNWGRFDELRSTAFFPSITHAEDLNVNEPFEYRSRLLRMISAASCALFTINETGHAGKTFDRVLCAIQNPPLTEKQKANLRTINIQIGTIDWKTLPNIPAIP